MKRIILIVVLIISFIILSIFVRQGLVMPFNEAIYRLVEKTHCPFLTSVAKTVSSLGTWKFYALIAVLLFSIPFTRGIALLSTFVLTVSALINQLLKMFFLIDRPDINRLIEITGYSFPSGHSQNAMAFIGFTALAFYGVLEKKRNKFIVCTVAVMFILLMGFSRIYLGVHYATDILGGYICGLAIIVIFSYKNPIKKLGHLQ